MSRIKKFAAAVTCAAALAASGVAAGAETLTDALIAAYRNSNLLEQNRAVLRAADEDVAVAVATLRPVLNFVTSINVNPNPGPTGDTVSGSIGLAAELTIIDFGRGQLGIDSAQEAVLATRSALVNVEQNVLFAAVSAYMAVRSAADTVALRENNVRLITQELRAAQDRFEVGEITRTDVAIAEARLAAARSNLAAAQGDLAVARENYLAATGAYPGALNPPPAPPRLPGSLEEAQAIARNTHPVIHQARHEVTISDLNVERAALAGAGTVTGGINFSVNDNGPNSSANIRYSAPLFTGGRLPALHRQAIARRDASRAGLHLTVVEVLQEVGRAWAELGVARAGIVASDLQIEASQTAYEGVRQEAALGARTTLDVLNAEQELLDARAARISAEAAQQVAVYSLLRAMGLLTVDHLNLGIPTYDPAAYYNAVRDAPVGSPQGEQLDRVLRALGRN